MQHSSQEPENLPYHVQTDLQRYELAQETLPPPALEQEIVVYTNRRQIIWRSVVGGICFLFVALFVPILALSEIFNGEPFDPGALMAFAVTLPLAVFTGWLVWTLLSPLLMHKPILVINREGIRVSPLPLFSGFFISWNETELLSPFAHQGTGYLGIVPKSPRQFLTRFNPVERFIRQTNTKVGVPALFIPQRHLDKPIEEILQQVYYIYVNELNAYHVQIRV